MVFSLLGGASCSGDRPSFPSRSSAAQGTETSGSGDTTSGFLADGGMSFVDGTGATGAVSTTDAIGADDAVGSGANGTAPTSTAASPAGQVPAMTGAGSDVTGDGPQGVLPQTNTVGQVDEARCGDGVLHIGEACDDGEANSDETPDACRTDCTRASCGDGALDTSLGEQCDDGDANSDETPDGCSTRCTVGCGNGVLDSDEQCDDGDANSDAQPGACRTDCTQPTCGDSVIDQGEQCDEGVANSNTEPSACRTTCVKATCGDNVVDLNEGCDDGTDNEDAPEQGCNTKCALASCGNGVKDAGEACDEGDANSDTQPGACRTTCQTATCGDGVKDTGEECDDGSNNSDTQADACRTTCTAPRCGDQVIDPSIDEECDGSENCSADCTAVVCGNNRQDEGEMCDPPDGESCDDQCQSIECGDGKRHASEACEPTGASDVNCTSNCTPIQCNDGKIEGAEECEPANDPNCTSQCRRPVCGDGLIAGTEVCDDKVNNNAYRGCAPGCASLAPYCGDGMVNGDEECDEGSGSSSNYGGCTANCTLAASCGDGIVQEASGEHCDSSDGCNNECNCEDGLSTCGTACIDPMTDVNFCGANASCSRTGNVCLSGQACAYGLCGNADWSIDTGASGSEISLQSPYVGMGNNIGVAVWLQNSDSGADQVWANTFTASGGWGTPKRIDGSSSEDHKDLQLAVNASGKAVAIWRDDTSIWSSYFNGSTWASRRQVDNDDSSDRGLSVAINDDGGARAAWRQNQTIWSASATSGAWNAPEIVTSLTVDNMEDPTVATYGDVSLVAWEQVLTGNTRQDVVVATSPTSGTSWPTFTPDTSTNNESPRVVMLSTSEHLVTFLANDVLVSKVRTGTSWGSTQQVDDQAYAENSSVRLTANTSGTAFAVWQRAGVIVANRYSVGRWGSPQVINPGGDGRDPDIAVDGIGNAVVVWEQEFQSEDRIWTRTFHSGSWRESTVLPASDDANKSARVGMNANGLALAVWDQGNALGSSHTQSPQ